MVRRHTGGQCRVHARVVSCDDGLSMGTWKQDGITRSHATRLILQRVLNVHSTLLTCREGRRRNSRVDVVGAPQLRPRNETHREYPYGAEMGNHVKYTDGSMHTSSIRAPLV